MADVFASPSTGKAPSPKPRNLSVSRLAASFEQQSTEKPQPLPRKKTDRGHEVKEGIPDYVNDIGSIRSAGITTRSLASQQQRTSPDSTPSPSAVKHILQISRNRLGSEGDGGSSDEEGRQYINCAPQELVQQHRPSEPAEAAVEGCYDQPSRRPVQQVNVETTGDSREMESYINCGPDSLATPKSLKRDDDADSYVEMNPSISRRLVMQREADNAYIKMNPAPRRASKDYVQKSIYQVPKSNCPVSLVDPQAVAGIYEIQPDANPLHPHHPMNVHRHLHSSSPLHDSLRQGSMPEGPCSSPQIATMHKSSRIPKTPPPKSRPPDCPPPDLTSSWSSSSFPSPNIPIAPSGRPMRSHSIDELGSSVAPLPGSPSAIGHTLRSYTNSMLGSPIAGGREVRPHSAVQQGSSSPVIFNPPVRQQKQKSGPPHLMGHIAGFHGRMPRKLAETRLGSASNAVLGDYIIRESTNAPPGKMQCVISLKTTSSSMHVIVDYRDGLFWMSASEKNQVSFASMEDLLQHYKEYPIVVDSKGNKVKLLNPIPLRRSSD